jgi:hypothetical protein
VDEQREVGVGPHPEPWPDDPRFDPHLLADGDRRNVVDRYRYWRRADWTGERDLPVIGIDNLPGAEPIDGYAIPERCALLFGQEGPGLSADARALATTVLAIRQFGSTRSINAAAASAVAMHEWVRRHAA